MRLKNILNEEKTFTLYQGLVRVKHTEEITASEVADFVRAMPGVTRVSAVDSNEDIHVVVLRVKVLTAKSGTQIFDKLQKDAFRLVPNIKKVEISQQSIESLG